MLVFVSGDDVHALSGLPYLAEINDRFKGRGSRIDDQGLRSSMDLQDGDPGGVARNNPINNLVIYSFRHFYNISFIIEIPPSTNNKCLL